MSDTITKKNQTSTQQSLEKQHVTLEEHTDLSRMFFTFIHYQTLLENKQLKQMLLELKDTRKHETIVQGSKMASIGQLAAGVAHEINNPIAFVFGNTTMLKKYFNKIKSILGNFHRILDMIDDSMEAKIYSEKIKLENIIEEFDYKFIMADIEDLINESLEGMSRVTEIVSDLKTFTRAGESNIQEADINQCLQSTLKLIGGDIKYKCKVNSEYGNIPKLRCYASQLNQVFMNLLINAVQAVDKNGEISIKTSVLADNIVIKISDNGKGIAPENIGKLCDPFFTTKPVGSGTGLGLSISYNIIKKHGGTINFKSKPDKGTIVTIKLPTIGINDAQENESNQ